MTKSLGFVFIISILLFSKAYSQNLNATGKVLDKQNHLAVQSANVKVYEGNNLLYQTLTDSVGFFKIPNQYFIQSSYFKISSLTFNELTFKIDVKKYNLAKNIDLGVFYISPKQVELKEVKISAKRRYRDTTKIDLSKEKFESSIMINDLLSKRYGFYRDDHGQLYYNGKIVSNLVVNGSDFFGQNNLDIYKLLPALVLDNIKVIETNIDSTTNTTMLRPTIKVNLTLKEKYNKGKFGNSSLGIGTESRYLTAANLYNYNNREQISLVLNSNNVNINNNFDQVPSINFSVGSNNTTAHESRFMYSNVFGKKVELNIAIGGKIENRNIISVSERQDHINNQFYRITNKSISKSSGISDANLSLRYFIDSLNTISLTQNNNFNNTKVADSLNYATIPDSINNFSNLSKTQTQKKKSNQTEISYTHQFLSKKGRILVFTGNMGTNNSQNTEVDNVYSPVNINLPSYFIDVSKILTERSIGFNSNYTNPLNEDAYYNVYLKYKNVTDRYDNTITSDSSFNTPYQLNKIRNNYIELGSKIQKTFSKISLYGEIAGLLDLRNILSIQQNSYTSFSNINANLRTNYKIGRDRNISLNIKTATDYPEITQLVNINNSYDLVFQSNGNPNLRPELDHSIKLNYSSNNGQISINAGVDFYNSKFGMRINTLSNTTQASFIDNIGNANTASIGLSFLKNVSDQLSLNYTNNLNYQEQPTIINGRFNLNNAIRFNQLIYTTKELVKNILTISPVITVGYVKYYYQSSSASSISLSYSDKLSLSIAKFEIDLYPFISYSHNINTITSFSTNGLIKRSIFKNYARIWIQGYDLFNSFKYNNNLIGASYTETTSFSNIKRYFIFGVSFNFNNMK